MSLVEDFLTAEEEQRIVAAIRQAEKTTSGEIRVHIEKHSELTVLQRASEVFFELNMDHTEKRNGVLIYIGVEDHRFAIIGDRGIDTVVPDDFWETTKNSMRTQFIKGNFCQGIIDGITVAGQQLQTYFPWDQNDINELSDEISKG